MSNHYITSSPRPPPTNKAYVGPLENQRYPLPDTHYTNTPYTTTPPTNKAYAGPLENPRHPRIPYPLESRNASAGNYCI